MQRELWRNKTYKSKQVTKESHCTSKYPHSRGFSSTGPRATLTVRKERSYNPCERKAYIGYRKEEPEYATLLLGLGQGKHSEHRGRRVGGKEGEGRGGRGNYRREHCRETRGGDADVGSEPFS